MKKIFCTCLLISTVLCAYTPAKEKEIRTETVLAETYDPLSRPAATTEVHIGINLLSVDVLDLPEQRFSASGWMTVEWKDDRLAWKASDKDDIEIIYADPSTIWHPELIVDNSIEELGVISDEDLLLSVEHNGIVEWEPTMLFNVHCDIDVSYYPYDHQKCGIEVTSWGFTTQQVVLEHMYDHINLEDYRQNGEWKVVKTDVSKAVITETRNNVTKTFSQLDFWMYMKRRYQFYNTNVMLPIILSSFLVTLVFVVPADSGEKLSYILTVLLTIAVFLTIIGETLPAISNSTSVLGIYLAATLCVAALATLVTVGILFIYHKKGEPKAGSSLCNLSRSVGKFCRVLDESEMEDAGTKAEEDAERSTNQEGGKKGEGSGPLTWINIAEIWDRFCFYFFVVLTILLNVIFIIILVAGGILSSKA